MIPEPDETITLDEAFRLIAELRERVARIEAVYPTDGKPAVSVFDLKPISRLPLGDQS